MVDGLQQIILEERLKNEDTFNQDIAKHHTKCLLEEMIGQTLDYSK